MQKLDLNGIIKDDKEDKKRKKEEKITITLREYLETYVQDDPLIAQFSPARLLEVIHTRGVEKIPDDEQWMGATRRYRLFEDLYDVEKSIEDLVNHIDTGANRASSGKMPVILVGPPGTGKSTAVSILANALENYNTRPMFMISGCPRFEEPLHILPRNKRKEFEKKLNVRIEGDLCPVCRNNLMTNYKDSDGVLRWWDVKVETFTFSKQNRRGITSFEAEGEKSSDVNALSGKENITITSVHGFEHPQAYELSGEIPKAERGLCEAREYLACDPEVLKIFFSVAEERQLKIPGSSFPHLSVDTIIIGHTNLTVFKEFAANKKYEGLQQRFYIILFPYPLRIKEEVKTYIKLIERESDFISLQKCHIAPGALKIAATFAVMTRYIESSKNIGLLTKAKLYNGEMVLGEMNNQDTDTLVHDVEELIREGQTNSDVSKREGMSGVTPRDVLAALNTALVQQSRSDEKCLSPLIAIKALREVFEHRMGYSPEELERFKMLLYAGESESAMSEYHRYVVDMVGKAYLMAYNDLARELFNRYINEVIKYRDAQRKFAKVTYMVAKRHIVTGAKDEPDERLMRSIEGHIPWTEEEAKVGRGEILELKSQIQNFSYDSYPPLKEAVGKKLLSDSRATLQIVLSTDKPKSGEEQARTKDIFNSLLEQGHCAYCAREAIEQAGEQLRE